jgi:hypothetical protein
MYLYVSGMDTQSETQRGRIASGWEDVLKKAHTWPLAAKVQGRTLSTAMSFGPHDHGAMTDSIDPDTKVARADLYRGGRG